MEKIVPIRSWGTVEGIIKDVTLETFPSDYSEGDRQVVVVHLEQANGIERRFYYPYSSAPNSKLNMLVERIEELLGDRVEYLSDIKGYFSRWRQYTKKIQLRDGDEIDVTVWLPTYLTKVVPAEFKSEQVEHIVRTERERQNVEPERPAEPVRNPRAVQNGNGDRQAIARYIESSLEKYGSVAIRDVVEALDVAKADVIEVATDLGYVIRNKVIFPE